MKELFCLLRNVLLLVFVGVLFYGVCWYDCHYAKDCAVVSVSNDVVTVRDAQGHLWEFIGDGYKVTDVVRVTFFTNHTDTVLWDDEITDVR